MLPMGEDEATLRRDAAAGDREAQAALGRRLYLQIPPPSPEIVEEAVQLILAAAHEGHGDAAHLAALITANDANIEDHWEFALAYLGRAAKAGHAGAQAQFAFLAGD